MSPEGALVDRTARFGLTKTWHGDLAGIGHGVMVSAGDPGAGAAGYVALEIVEGTLAGRAGGLAFAQLGLMTQGRADLTYVVVPGSGHGELVGLTGRLELDAANGHTWVLTYELPD